MTLTTKSQYLDLGTVQTYRILNDLPHPPEHLIKQSLELVYGEVPPRRLAIRSSVFKNRTIVQNGETKKPIISRRYDVSVEFRQWIEENIAENFRETSICCAEPNDSHWHAAHTDWSRDYLLVYVLNPGGDACRTCWYDVPDPSVIKQDTTWTRRRKPQTWVENYDDLKLSDYVRMPQRGWTVMNATTMHGVENITEDRVSIHVGLDGSSILKSTQS